MGQAATKQQKFWEACSYGREWLVKDMLEEGDIDVDWISHISDCCPIHVASQGNVGIVKLLIDARCNVNALDNGANTALHHAAMAGKSAACEMLIEASADIDPVNQNGWSPLFNACYWHRAMVVEILLMNKANVHLVNKAGRKCIHELCRSTCDSEEDEMDLVVILERLHEAGADLSEKSKAISADLEADFSPLIFACYHGHTLLAQRLIQFEVDLEQTDLNGWTALHWAAQRGRKDMVTMLLLNGADPHCRSIRNESPSDVTNSEEIITLLTDPSSFPYPVIESNGNVTTDDED